MRGLINHLDIELREALLPLAVGCPLDQSNPKDCPLYSVRKMHPAQQSHWFNALHNDGLSYLAAYHAICLHTKLTKLFVANPAGLTTPLTSVA